MSRDPLSTLARLRRIEVETAQRSLAEARAALARQEEIAARAEAILREEQTSDLPVTYGAFLAHGLAFRQAQREAAARAEVAREAEREALALARGAERVIGILRERRAVQRRRAVLRRDQARLEDALPRA